MSRVDECHCVDDQLMNFSEHVATDELHCACERERDGNKSKSSHAATTTNFFFPLLTKFSFC